ncbi:MAG TPA: hypothetical protein VFD39_08320 [Trueperaceae bacterium]|nr:hypothetical protein [Trueperaceae bacterium]
MPRPEIAALSALLGAAEALGLTVLVIGAFARELIVDVPYGGRPYRATRDVDAAVRVASWESYRALVAALVEEAGFRRISDHRVQFEDGTPIDLLPFGGVVNAQGNLSWDDADRTLSLAGLEAAADNTMLRITGH